MELLIWVVILGVAYGFCIFASMNLISEWMNATAVISFENRALDVHEIPFPAITICSSNKIRPSFANITELLLKTNKTQYESDMLSFSFQMCFTSIQPDASMFLNKAVANLALKEAIHNCSDTMSVLKWKTRLLPDPCQFMQKVVTNRGICHVFNGVPFSTLFKPAVGKMYEDLQVSANLTSWYKRTLSWALDTGYNTNELGISKVTPLRTVGSEETLTLKLNLHIDDFDPGCVVGFKGFTMVFHNPLEIANEAHASFAVEMDSLNKIKVDPSFQSTSKNIRGWSPERRDCYFDHEKSLVYFRNYTEKNCYSECESNRSYAICGCVPIHLPRLEHMELCGPLSADCHTRSIGEFDSLEEYKEMCDCRPSCSDLRYEVSGYTIPINWTYIDPKMHTSGAQVEEKRDNTAAVTVSFSARTFIPMQRDSVSQIHDFIGNIGGTLGLFLGFSFISLMEIVYFLIMSVIYTIFKK